MRDWRASLPHAMSGATLALQSLLIGVHSGLGEDLFFRYVVESHRSNIVHRTAVAVPIQKPARLPLLLLAAKESAKQSAQSIGADALLLFLLTQMSHHNRCQHHQDLPGLAAA